MEDRNARRGRSQVRPKDKQEDVGCRTCADQKAGDAFLSILVSDYLVSRNGIIINFGVSNEDDGFVGKLGIITMSPRQRGDPVAWRVQGGAT